MEYNSEKTQEDKDKEEAIARDKKLKKSLQRAENTISQFSALLKKYNKEKNNGSSA